MLSADSRLQSSNRLLNVSDFEVSGITEPSAFLNLLASAAQFGRVTCQQAVQFALESNASIFCGAFFSVLQPHHGGEVFGIRFATGGDA